MVYNNWEYTANQNAGLWLATPTVNRGEYLKVTTQRLNFQEINNFIFTSVKFKLKLLKA